MVVRDMAKHKKRKLQEQPRKVGNTAASRGGAPKSKKQSKQQKQESIIPFDPTSDRILLIGEGDFSFAKSVVENHGAYDIVATCYDSQADLFAKYDPQAKEHVSYLEEEGQVVLYGVDATKLSTNKSLKKGGQLFDRILFNFPHVGGKSTDVNRQVRFNQKLLVDFFAQARDLLADEGTIVVTLFEGEPYTLWNIKDLARTAELQVQRSFKFMADAYPGYSHARTLGNIEGGGGWKGEDREARSHVFQQKEANHETLSVRQQQLKEQDKEKKRKRDDSSESEDD